MLSKQLSKNNIFLQKKRYFSLLDRVLSFGALFCTMKVMPRQSMLLKVCSLDHLGAYKCKFMGPALHLLTQKLWAEAQKYEF